MKITKHNGEPVADGTTIDDLELKAGDSIEGWRYENQADLAIWDVTCPTVSSRANTHTIISHGGNDIYRRFDSKLQERQEREALRREEIMLDDLTRHT